MFSIPYILPKPKYEDHKPNETYEEMISRCRRNYRIRHDWRSKRLKLLPEFIRNRIEKNIWKEAFSLLSDYRVEWKKQRAFMRNIIATRALLDRI